MDAFTRDHLVVWSIMHLHSDERWRFVSFAADLLQDKHELEYYMAEGWQRLYDRFFDERLAAS